ncbi:MAG: Hsp70 family protein [bacterium]
MAAAPESRRIAVGIDLGTTNSALAWADYSPGLAQIRPVVLPIRQMVALGEVQVRQMLPSAVYLSAEGEFTTESTRLPWQLPEHSGPIVGELARQLGPRVPTRFVVSAKSWLCHDRVERSAPILPWGSPPDSKRISPVDASRLVLEHLRDAFNNDSKFRHLRDLPIVLTVPASFDESARRLTVEAAKQAGLSENITLLEEPQAAFYAWIADHPGKWQDQLRAGETILVCDVGGGTTDFTLIAATEDESGPGFERVAVGDHLMLGGDNMDLALAHLVEGHLGQRLSVDQWTSLRAQARAAKEKMLGENPPQSVSIGITGKGSRVVGGSMSATLTRDEVLGQIVEGFFPECRIDDHPAASGRSGFQEFGLPFEQEPAITRHMAAFLASVSAEKLPSALLFNGGALKPAIIRERIVKTLRGWLVAAGRDPESLRVLENPDLDLAVARGAAYYAAVRQGGAGLRMRSGLARSLYIGLAQQGGPENWLCVVPRNAQEGEPYPIPATDLQLLAGRRVAFPLATSSIRAQDAIGDILPQETKGLRALPPLEAEIRVGRKAKAEQVPVRLDARVNPIGTVDLWCVSLNDPLRWVLEIGVRSARAADTSEDTNEKMHVPGQPEKAGVIETALLEKAGKLISTAFAQAKAEAENGPQRLVKSMEEALESPRDEWPASACRAIFEFLRKEADQRKKSPGHEARWLNLAGYCLRPGLGQSCDDQRIKFVWSLASVPLAYPKENQVWVEWWVLWRRLAPALNRAQQEEIWRRIQAVLTGQGKKPDRKIAAQELAEMTRTGASLERLEPAVKLQFGDALLQRLAKERDQATTLLWALARVGSRQPLYGPVSSVIPAGSISGWLQTLFTFEPTTNRETDALKLALGMIARKEVDRSLDFSDDLRLRARDRSKAIGMSNDNLDIFTEYKIISEQESERALGESLPTGLLQKSGVED